MRIATRGSRNHFPLLIIYNLFNSFIYVEYGYIHLHTDTSTSVAHYKNEYRYIYFSTTLENKYEYKYLYYIVSRIRTIVSTFPPVVARAAHRPAGGQRNIHVGAAAREGISRTRVVGFRYPSPRGPALANLELDRRPHTNNARVGYETSASRKDRYNWPLKNDRRISIGRATAAASAHRSRAWTVATRRPPSA